jgi:flagellar hook-associated protein 3 FlgL
VNLANLSYQGSFVFAGSVTGTAPYVLDPNSSSGVDYLGNSESNTITLGNDFTIQTNLPGSQLFSAPGNNMFQSIQDLITSLQTGTNVSGALGEVSNAYSYINSQRVFYGNAVDQLNSQSTYLNTETTQLAEQQNTLGAANLPAVISGLESSEVGEQATLEGIAQTQQTNLFSYLR